MIETKAITPAVDELRDLIDRCQKKKPAPADLAELRRILARGEAWREFDLAHQAAIHAIEQYSGESKFVGEVIRADYEGRRRELGAQDAAPLERALVDHAALCWVRLQAMEQKYDNVMAQSITLALADYWDRHLAAAQRRYLRAVETLARVRRLRLPAVQINVAEKQVNVAKS